MGQALPRKRSVLAHCARIRFGGVMPDAERNTSWAQTRPPRAVFAQSAVTGPNRQFFHSSDTSTLNASAIFFSVIKLGVLWPVKMKKK
jgi:hypothetical protein